MLEVMVASLSLCKLPAFQPKELNYFATAFAATSAPAHALFSDVRMHKMCVILHNIAIVKYGPVFR
jgi:hypothetical protein